jgi:1-deoxy-D-xylulose-5-phosphate synthase
VFAIDRAGLNSADGPTHHGIFDVAFLSQIPNLNIYTPITYEALHSVMNEALQLNAPAAIRYPNGYEDSAIIAAFYSQNTTVLGRVRADYSLEEKTELDAVIITHGRITAEALKAKEALGKQGKRVGIILLEQLKPYDMIAANIATLLPEHSCRVLFLEEEIKAGGMGMNLSAALSDYDVMQNKSIQIRALDNHFALQTKNESIWKSACLDCDAIMHDILF